MYTKMIHRLVAEAFVENPRPDLFNRVDHIDHNPHNNAFTNLRWVDGDLNKVNVRGDCVVEIKRNKHRPWCSMPYRLKRMYFVTREEAVACSLKRKRERFEKMYKEKLESEPRFKSVGVQCNC